MFRFKWMRIQEQWGHIFFCFACGIAIDIGLNHFCARTFGTVANWIESKWWLASVFSELSLESCACALPLQYLDSCLQPYHFPPSLKHIIARLLKTVKSALITFFFLFPKPISVRFSQRSLSIGSGRGCGGRQWRIGRKWRADRSQLAGQRTVEALRSRLLQGLQVLSGGEVALGTIDGHWPVLPDWIKYTFLPPNSLFNWINETWLGQGHGITNKTEQQYM